MVVSEPGDGVEEGGEERTGSGNCGMGGMTSKLLQHSRITVVVDS